MQRCLGGNSSSIKNRRFLQNIRQKVQNNQTSKNTGKQKKCDLRFFATHTSFGSPIE
jgi:hypothetical protein